MIALRKNVSCVSFFGRAILNRILAFLYFTTVLTALVLAVSPAAFAAPRVLDRVLVVIGDKAILQSDLDKSLADIKKTPSMSAAYRLTPAEVTPEKLLERLIEEKIIQQVVKEKGLEVTDAEVEKQISSIAQQNKIGRADLAKSLANEGIPFEVYKTNIKAQLERRNLFDRELRSGGGVSEAELRSVYDRKASTELNLNLVHLPKSPVNEAKLKALVAQIKAKKLSPTKAVETNAHEELGWMKPVDLSQALKKTLGTLNEAGAAGPVVAGKNLQVIVITSTRKGSEDEFLKVKDSLMAQAQAEDFEKRFSIWLERKKEDMQIVRNKI